ncbi:MAG: response regulator [Suipraeoptans sp.]
MFKLLICDDEGIVRESLQYIVSNSFGDECKCMIAKNGRQAIEIAEEFRPDIIMMDIQMPGINGIEAMQEIRSENKNVVFVVLTAYDKFEYSQAAIDLGVFSYLTKPINKDVFCDVIRSARKKVEERKKKASSDLALKEKMEAVVPIIESGFVYSVVLEKNGNTQENLGYKELLGVDSQYWYAMLIECGDELHKGRLSNIVGAGVKLQKSIMVFRDTIKEMIPAVIGEIMANKVIILVPCDSGAEDYEDRVRKINEMRALLKKLEQQIDLKFKAGIGKIKKWSQISDSYKEALDTVSQGLGKVTHANDLPVSCVYEDNYPIDIEDEMFACIEDGDAVGAAGAANAFAEWMKNSVPTIDNSVRLKTIEFVLWAERLAYMQGGMLYRFDDRRMYLDTLMSLNSYTELTSWFVKKIEDATKHIADKQHEKTDNVIDMAKSYIKDNFSNEITLEVLAREIGISPYYLSKLFKEIEGINYIEYITNIRMEFAKDKLMNTDNSIKEICHESGYSNPNYFSRIFKKSVGATPSEFREKG